MEPYGFKAMIYEVKTRSLKSGDRSTRIILEIDAPDDALLEALAKLQRADAPVGVALAEGQR